MKYGLVLFASAVALHFLAEFLGVFDYQIANGFVWIDNVVHAFVGASIALCALSVVAVGRTWHYRTRFVLGFVFGLAVLWELAEFLFFVFHTELATELKIYSPSLTEALVDMGSNMFGGVVLLLWKHKSS